MDPKVPFHLYKQHSLITVFCSPPQQQKLWGPRV